MELHTVADELPSGDTGDMVPVVLVTAGVGMVPNGVASVAVTVTLVRDVETVPGTADGLAPAVPPTAGIEFGNTAGIPGAICPDGTEQVTTVPGVVGSEASGTGASVVSGAPGWVVDENGLGPSSGDMTIVPGVDGRPMAVVPMVETCARLALQPSSKAIPVNSRRRI